MTFGARGFRVLVALLLVGLAIGSFCRAADFEPPDVHQLAEHPDEFLDKTSTVTGRFGSYGGGVLRFLGSDIEFRFAQPGPRIRPGLTHLDVSGQLRRDGKGLHFEAETYTPLESETARFARRRSAINPPNHPGLYDLSRWARDRARWYDDKDLHKLATDTYREAFRWEEDQAAQVHDVELILRLADRGEKLGLEEGEVERIRHRALRIAADRLGPADAQARVKLAGRLRKLLPATDKPLPADAQPFVDKYNADPVAGYASLDEQQRKLANRAFWVALVANALEIEATGPGVELDEMSRRAAELLPDRPALSRRFEIDFWDRRVGGDGRLTRDDVIAARDAYQRLGEDDRARQLIARWLDGRQASLAPQEVEDRLALADDYQRLADDRETAATLLREVLNIVPGMEEAEKRLGGLGFEKVDGTWKPKSDTQPAAGAGPPPAIRAGDSEAVVLANFRKPDRVARVAGAGWMIEQWIYEGPPTLYVFLRRNTATDEATVLRVAAP